MFDHCRSSHSSYRYHHYSSQCLEEVSRFFCEQLKSRNDLGAQRSFRFMHPRHPLAINCFGIYGRFPCTMPRETSELNQMLYIYMP